MTATPPPVEEHYATEPAALVPVVGAAFLYQCPTCRLWVRQTHQDAQSFVDALLDPRVRTCSRCTSTLDTLERELEKDGAQ